VPNTPQQWRDAIKASAKTATAWPFSTERFVAEMDEIVRLASEAQVWALTKRGEEEGDILNDF
jgi:hypothetical protein